MSRISRNASHRHDAMIGDQWRNGSEMRMNTTGRFRCEGMHFLDSTGKVDHPVVGQNRLCLLVESMVQTLSHLKKSVTNGRSSQPKGFEVGNQIIGQKVREPTCLPCLRGRTDRADGVDGRVAPRRAPRCRRLRPAGRASPPPSCRRRMEPRNAHSAPPGQYREFRP